MKKLIISESERNNILKKHNCLITEADGRNFTVTDIQNFLKSNGFSVSVDGILGPQTISAYKQFLTKNNKPEAPLEV
jgi:peptidoglycan hydrolase-like protein with peptidoglycan-binding domain